MNPFIAMLIQQLLNGSGTNQFWNSPFGQAAPDASNDYGSAFVRNMFGQVPDNPFIFSPFPSYGQGLPFGQGVRQIGIGRNLGQGQPSNRPIGQRPGLQYDPSLNQPVPIPAPRPNLQPLPNQPIYDDPGANNPGGPLGPMIPSPYQTPPYIPPRDFANPQQFFIEPLPGIKVPINMTGLPGSPSQQGIPNRDINYLPPIPRGLGGMSR
jgi:hypothetical protein